MSTSIGHIGDQAAVLDVRDDLVRAGMAADEVDRIQARLSR
ncbi:hypothetical protein [Amycolatopsis orientalis]|nr:hypothetical protein [Amycolatopsis orientalis]